MKRVLFGFIHMVMCSAVIIIIFNTSGSFHYQSAGITDCKLWLSGTGLANRKSNGSVFPQELVKAMCLEESPRTEAQTHN